MRLLSALFAGVLAIFLVRKLGPAGYGVFALAVSIGSLLLFPADLGVSLSAARFAAENRGDRTVVKAILADSLWIKLVAGLVLCGGLFAAAGPIASAYGSPGLEAPLRYTALAVFGQSIGALAIAWTEALGRVSIALAYTAVESSVETGVSIVVVLLGAGAAGAAFGRLAGFGVAAGYALLATARLFGPPLKRYPGVGPGLEKIARYGTALLIVDGVIVLFDKIDVLVISAYLGTEAAGLFEAPSRLISFLGFGVLALSTGFAPLLSGSENTAPDADSFWKATRIAILLQVLLAVPMIVWAKPITDLALGSDYSASAPVMRALAPLIVLAGVGQLFAIGVNYLGRAQRRVLIAIGAVVVNLALDLLLVPRIGIIAGAIGSTAAFLLYVPAHVLIVREALGMPAKALARTCLRALLAALVAAAALFAFGTDQLTALEWIGGTIAATVGYLATLLLSREVGADELRRGRDSLRGALPWTAASP